LKRTDAEEDLEKILYLDMKLYLQDNMLVKIDRASMAHSLEARVPYLDHEVVEFFCRIPLDKKYKKLRLKYLFKKLALRYLPPEIVNRPKKGFGMPIAKWLIADSTAHIKNKILTCSYYNRPYIETLITEHESRECDHRKKLWNLYCGTFC
jgi:asparagine synthase (glutamine-hydrolysing)